MQKDGSWARPTHQYRDHIPNAILATGILGFQSLHHALYMRIAFGKEGLVRSHPSQANQESIPQMQRTARML